MAKEKSVGSWLKKNKKRIIISIGVGIAAILLPFTVKCRGATEKINKEQFVEMHWNEIVKEIQFNPKNSQLKNLLEQACIASQKGNKTESRRFLLETKKAIQRRKIKTKTTNLKKTNFSPARKNFLPKKRV